MVGDAGITVTSPAAGEVWQPGESHTITWIVTGSLPAQALIIVYYPGSDFSTSDYLRTWQAVPVGTVGTTAGSVTWAIGTASWYLRGPVRLRVTTTDHSVHGDSGLFAIGAPSITVTGPGGTATWSPHKPYTVTWQISGFADCVPIAGGQPDAVDISLIRAGAASHTVLAERVTGGSHTAMLGPIDTGGYFVRIQHSANPLLGADSPQFHVESVLGPDVGFLEPAPGPGAGLVLEKVFFDGIDVGSLAVRIRNMGDPYTGPLRVDYTLGTPNHPPAGPVQAPYAGIDETAAWADGKPHDAYIPGGISIGKYEIRTVPFLNWVGFAPEKTAQPSAPVPRCGPVYATVAITPPEAVGTPPQFRTFTGIIAKTPAADIVADHHIGFFWGGVQAVGRVLTPGRTKAAGHLWMYRWTIEKILEPDLPWIHGTDSFVAGIFVGLANYGAVPREFDCVLSVDMGPAQPLGKVTLRPGERRYLQWNTTVTLPQRFGLHEVVFVADPDEYQDEPYPNAYDNNFIYVVWDVVGGGTIYGHV